MGTDINFIKHLGRSKQRTSITPQTSSEFTNTYSTDYDGIDQYVGIGTGILQFNRTTPFTISVWAYMRATEFAVIIGKSHNGGDFEGYQLYTLAATGAKNQIVFRIRKSSSQVIQIASTNTFNRNQWYHIAITYNGSGANGGLKLYVSGIDQPGIRTGTLTQDLTWSPDRPFNIGSRANGGNAFNGLIDEPAIFTSELSAANIESIYNNGVPNDISIFSPTSWWRFEEGSGTIANDSGSSGHTGTLNNSLSYSTNVPTFNRNSLLLDGIDAYIDCGSASTLNFERTDSFSFSFWVKRNSTGTNDVMVARQNASGNQRGYFVNLNTSDRLVIQLRNNTSNNSQRLNVQSTTLINTTNWYHIAITYDGTSTVNSFKMYIDGERDVVTNKLGTLSATIQAPSALFLIGSLHTGVAAPADAFMDEIAVFDSVLTDGGVSEGQTAGGQIAEIYNSGTPNDLTLLSPISWWRCADGDYTPILNDRGSASNDGDLENTAAFSTDIP